MKLKLTESQFDRLKEKLTETNNDDTYYGIVDVDFRYFEVTYKGRPINDISMGKIKISFGIYLGYKRWGIDSIEINNIKGPSELEAEIDYFIDEDNSVTENITLQIDWSRLVSEKINNSGQITIGDKLEIIVNNDEDGNLFVNELKLDIFSI